MAVNGADKTFANMEFPLSIKRQDAFSVDLSEVQYSLEEAQAYAQSDPTAYVGQALSVVIDGVATRYIIKNEAGDIEPIGGGIDEESIATDEEVAEMLAEVFPS